MKECAIEDCNRPHRAEGMCTGHLYRRNAGLPLDGPLRQYVRGGRRCEVGDCGRRHEAYGLCPMHLQRQKRHGSPGAAGRERAPWGEATWHDPDVSRDKKLRLEYGLTPQEYDRLLVVQGGGCAVCKSPDPRWKRARAVRSFSVDHDHETGHVRGLLCSPCNRGVGLLQDSPEVLEAAARYLRAARQIPLFGPAKSA